MHYGNKLSAMISTCITIKGPDSIKNASGLNEEILKWIRMKVEKTDNENQIIKKLQKTIEDML